MAPPTSEKINEQVIINGIIDFLQAKITPHSTAIFA